MKKFLNKIITLILFLIAASIAYIGITVLFKSILINICLIIIAIFVLIQACANIDRTYGLGQNNNDNN